MEQLQKDRDYTKFLVRIIEQEIRKNSFKNKNELMAFINKIRQDLNTKQVIDYVNNNRLIFNYQEFQIRVNQIVNNFDIMMQNIKMQQERLMQEQMKKQVNNQQVVRQNMNNQMHFQQQEQPNYIPLTKVDVNSVSKDLIERINFLIVNPKVDVNNVLVDTKSGNFVDIVKRKPVLITKNKDTNAFELVEDQKEKQEEQKNQKIKPMAVEPQKQEVKSKPKVKTRKLIMPKIVENNKAFISTVLITAVCAISGIVIASVILVK